MKQKKGFSLVELLTVLAIIGILMAIAIPSYQNYVTNARRTDGQVALLDLATKMERYFALNNSFSGATLANVGANTGSSEGHYNLAINSTTATTFALTAAPTGIQATHDKKCATLTLNHLGVKGATGSGTVTECW